MALIRKRECLSCHHTWTALVVLSKHTTNLSGEATVWCPRCTSRSVMSSPAEPANPEAYECAACGYHGFGAWNCNECGNHDLIRTV